MNNGKLYWGKRMVEIVPHNKSVIICITLPYSVTLDSLTDPFFDFPDDVYTSLKMAIAKRLDDMFDSQYAYIPAYSIKVERVNEEIIKASLNAVDGSPLHKAALANFKGIGKF